MKSLRIRQAVQLTGLSQMTIYRLELAGEIPVATAGLRISRPCPQHV